ncbi:MAG: hypothetical protein JWQ79_2572 [Mucilaginibacter sp.]|nr:hypothetical protein [Mucilaginibacter sp.]
MNKRVLIFLFLLAAASAFGQKKSKVNLISSTFAERNMGPHGESIIKVHNGVFQQDFSTLRSDSALFYPDQNMVDAFGHVNINQGDTLNIFSDKLNYNGNTKIAILTDNVKMIDKGATLTTNYFTYNTATRIGTYTGGGKLVNKESTLVSKNGYYFAFSHDEYFRYNVVCTTPDAVIKTDTMRYNSTSRITYFYGPTNIYGKDKDVLYTENGTYNTATEQAFFGKNNLYTQGTKTLKGDSLFYDRLKGYGRAVKHVTFNDSEQKATIKGDLGEYYKPEERTVMTQNPYMIFVTEKDSTATNKPAANKPGIDSLLKSQKPLKISNKEIKPAKGNTANRPADQKLTLQGITDSVTKKLPANIKVNEPNKKLTLQGITDSVTSKIKPQANGKAQAQKTAIAKNVPPGKATEKDARDLVKKPDSAKTDSLFLVADTLETQIVTYKALKTLQEKQYQATHRDTSIKIVKKAPPIVYKKSPKFLTLDPPKRWERDTGLFKPEFFGKPDPPRKIPPKVVKINTLKKPVVPVVIDSVKLKRKADSLAKLLPKVLSDTARVRIIAGHHHAKIFKSDLQGKADSMFYSTSDSTIRCYVNPIIWTQGSQLSGDTVNLQMKNKKLDNMDMFPNAFIVNIENNDSTHFNQIGGRMMHGTFKNSKLNTMHIIGNAETIYFKRDSVKNIVTDMSRTVSGSIFVRFKNGEVQLAQFYANYEGRGVPIAKTKEEDRILKNFIWKPKERPASKESVLSSYHPKPAAAKGATAKPPGKPLPKKPGDKKLGNDTTAKPPAIKMGKDSTLKLPPIKTGKDTTIKSPAIKMGKDSVVKKAVKDTSTIKKPLTVTKKP